MHVAQIGEGDSRSTSRRMVSNIGVIYSPLSYLKTGQSMRPQDHLKPRFGQAGIGGMSTVSSRGDRGIEILSAPRLRAHLGDRGGNPRQHLWVSGGRDLDRCARLSLGR
jgi:hypothetical protein